MELHLRDLRGVALAVEEVLNMEIALIFAVDICIKIYVQPMMVILELCTEEKEEKGKEEQFGI